MSSYVAVPRQAGVCALGDQEMGWSGCTTEIRSFPQLKEVRKQPAGV